VPRTAHFDAALAFNTRELATWATGGMRSFITHALNEASS